MLSWLFGKRKKPAAARVDRRQVHALAARIAGRLVAKYDAAQTTDEDTRYWRNVDGLSADAAHSPEVRRVLRNRSRYEVGNGGYANGMVKQKANDLVGTGPRLQIHTGDDATDQKIETEWTRWSKATRFARTLRTATRCRVREGAALGILTQNPKLPTRSKLHFRLVEIDRLTTPDLSPLEPDRVDGIDFDPWGNPEWYHILDQHPGSASLKRPKATRYPASHVVHWFDEDRAEQHHGIPELTPSLRTFGNHRRWHKATIRAAEVAAEIAAFFTTNQPANADDEDETRPEAMDVIDLEFGGTMVAPDGYDVKQVEGKHPNSTFGEFNEQVVTEEARPLLMPANIASGNSSKYNYASGRLDNQSYDMANKIDRDDLEIIVVDPVFEQWLRETLSEISGIAPSDIDVSQYSHEWHWDSRGHVDPSKESASQDTDLKNGSLTFPTLYARQGRDWRTEFQKQADALGIRFEEFQALVRKALYERSTGTPAAPPNDSAKDDADEEDAETKPAAGRR